MANFTPVGMMNDEVELLRPTRTKDSTGQEVLSWTKFQTLMAKVSPISGRELIQGLSAQSDITYRVNFPYYPAIEADTRVLVPTDWSTLSGGINDAVTSIPVTDYTQFSLKTNDFYAKIESEIIKITAGQGTSTFTGTRGQLGTSAAAHSSGVYIIPFILLEVKFVQNVNFARVETEILCSSLGSLNV